MTKFFFDSENSSITLENGTKLDLVDPKAFRIISQAWLRSGWDTKYVYGFSWLGRPIIQLPEDIIRIQELIYSLKPDVIIETGVAHGGSLIFYASLCNAIGKGRVIGIDIEIRAHNRDEIEKHKMKEFITLIEGSSIDEKVIKQVKSHILNKESVLVVLDSNHSKEHVEKELHKYSKFIKKGGYIIACDGIMKEVKGAPRTEDDWDWNNPISAIRDFLVENDEFEIVEPKWPFNEGFIKERITYWPQAYLRKK